jgi:hypothetical protein
MPDIEVRTAAASARNRALLLCHAPPVGSIGKLPDYHQHAHLVTRTACGCRQRAQRPHLPLCPAFSALIWQQQRERVWVGEGGLRWGISECDRGVGVSAHTRAHVHMSTSHTLTHSVTFVFVCVFHAFRSR